jgi:hypothetical protein
MTIRRPHDKLLEFLAPYGKEITRLALDARRAVLRQDPEAIELIYDAYNAVVTAFSQTDLLKDASCSPIPRGACKEKEPASVTSKSKMLES